MSTWKPIPGYLGRYEASDDGRVRSLFSGGIVLRAWPTTQNYMRVALYDGTGARIPKHVHALVMLAHVGPTPSGLQIRHLDGDRSNNRLENLRYGTQVENNLDTLRHGRHRNANKTHCPHGHPYDEANTYVRIRDGYQHRQCKECNRNNVRRLRDRRRASKEAVA